MKTFLTFLIIPIVLLFVLPISVKAANYKVTPKVIDKEVKQRDIFSETIKITNNENHNLNIYPSVNEVSVDDGGDISAFRPASVSDNSTTPTSWVSISRARITVAAGQTKEIPINFKINPEAKSGLYHLFIGFGTGNNRPTAEKQVAEGQAPGVIVTLSIDREKTEFLKLTHFIIKKFITKPDNKAITYTLDNPGTADVVPTGEIIFYDGRGVEVGSTKVNPDKTKLTPGQETTYSINAPTEGMLGQYKAFLTIDYGTTQLASVYDTEFFYVLPWQKILIFFLLFMFIAIVLTIILHRKFGSSEHHDGSEAIPLFIKDTPSENKEHDINLKQ